MNTVSYNCPCCGGPLKFSGESGKLECTACGNHYEPEALEMMTPDESGDEITFANDAKRFDTGGGRHAGQPVERVFLSHMLLSLHGFRRLFCCAFRLFCRRERAGRELLPHKSNAARREKMACPFVIETARGCTGRCG